jgi:hypothetical protein
MPWKNVIHNTCQSREEAMLAPRGALMQWAGEFRKGNPRTADGAAYCPAEGKSDHFVMLLDQLGDIRMQAS